MRERARVRLQGQVEVHDDVSMAGIYGSASECVLDVCLRARVYVHGLVRLCMCVNVRLQ